MVEKAGFLQFVKNAYPNFEMPSRVVMGDLLQREYDTVRKKLLREIALCSSVATTTDGYTDKYTQRKFVTVTSRPSIVKIFPG